MREIRKSDIVGARVVAIHEAYELSEDGVDCRQIYFTVDRGFIFTIPNAGYPFGSVELPGNADLLPDEFKGEEYLVKRGWFGRLRFSQTPSSKIDIVGQIKQRRISGIYCGLFDKELGFHYPYAGTILFDDGSQASNNVFAPHGTGAAGLYFFRADSGRCTPLDQLVDYFSIPLDKPDT